MISVWPGTHDPRFNISGKHFVKTGKYRPPNLGEFFLIGHEVYRMINADYTRNLNSYEIMEELEES
jgi:hypothetical protein